MPSLRPKALARFPESKNQADQSASQQGHDNTALDDGANRNADAGFYFHPSDVS
jgi:hypothetical protein